MIICILLFFIFDRISLIVILHNLFGIWTSYLQLIDLNLALFFFVLGVILRPGFIYGTRRVGSMKLPLGVIGSPLEMVLAVWILFILQGILVTNKCYLGTKMGCILSVPYM